MRSCQNALASTSTKHCSTPILSPRSINVHTRTGTAFVAAMAIGLFVLVTSLSVYCCGWKLHKVQKSEEEQIGIERPGVGEQTGLYATNQYENSAQQASLQTGFDYSSIPIEELMTFKRDFLMKKQAEGTNRFILRTFDEGDDTTSSIDPTDSRSMAPHMSAILDALSKELDRYIMQRWMEAHGGLSGLQQNNAPGTQPPQSPTRGQGNVYSENIQLERLPSPSPAYFPFGRSNDTPPPIPARSASRSTVRSSATGHRPEQALTVTNDQQRLAYRVGGMMNGESSRQLTSGGQIVTRSVVGTIASRWSAHSDPSLAESGLGSEGIRGGPDRRSHAAETDISDDPFAHEARTNYQRRDQGIRPPMERQYHVGEMARIQEENRQHELLDNNRRESED